MSHTLNDMHSVRFITNFFHLWFQSCILLWEQVSEHSSVDSHTYHSYRSPAGIAMAVVRTLLAAIFATHLRARLQSERSALKRDFYNSFTKVHLCMLKFVFAVL